jgi:hypothetical protein
MQEIINRILTKLIAENATRIESRKSKVLKKRKQDGNQNVKPNSKSKKRKVKMLLFILAWFIWQYHSLINN